MKNTMNSFYEHIQTMCLGDYKEMGSGGHAFEGEGFSKDSFYNDIYGSMLTFIEAISDKDTVNQRKSIVKQLLREKQRHWIQRVWYDMKNTEIQETTIQFKNIKTGKIVSSDMLFINDYSDGGSNSIGTTLDNINKDYEIIR